MPGSLVGDVSRMESELTSAKTPSPPSPIWDRATTHEFIEPGGLAFITTTNWQVAVLIASWMAVGLATALALKKRGHEFGPNAALGVILGPVFVFLAFDMARRRERDEPIRLSAAPGPNGSPVLVVAVGEIEEPGAALRAVTAEQTGAVTVAVPVEYEVAERVHGMGEPPPSSDTLDVLAGALAGFSPARMMLPGRPDTSIPVAVKRTGARMVIMVGSESASAAPDLERDLRIPVLRVGPSTPR